MNPMPGIAKGGASRLGFPSLAATIAIVLAATLPATAQQQMQLVPRLLIVPGPGAASGTAKTGDAVGLNPQPEPPSASGLMVLPPGSFVGLNPQPEPPMPECQTDPLAAVGLNPQPEPPSADCLPPAGTVGLNPQPEPPSVGLNPQPEPPSVWMPLMLLLPKP